MTLKKARIEAGMTQSELSATLGIPLRTIENWESGSRQLKPWLENLIIGKISSFKIANDNVKIYSAICKDFSHATADWSELSDFKFYTTVAGHSWEETCDNAHGGIDVSWAFHLSDFEIEAQAGETLYDLLMNELNVAIDDGWDLSQIQALYETFDF